jgi:uncharacterized repeat protein (TIGR03803 family)
MNLPSCLFCLALAFMPALVQAQTFTDIHDFDCSVEGCIPTAPEVLVQGHDGNLYGTTNQGGTNDMGTVFKMTPAGVLTTLYNFSGADGWNPVGGLTLGQDGNFYGATRIGGANNIGTIFKITSTGHFTLLHSFGPGEGSNPVGTLTLGRNGNFYGTTCSQYGPWVGFEVTPSGSFRALTGFIPPCPYGGMILGNDGNFYGTSQVGGASYEGTVFRMTPTGDVTLVYSFDLTHGIYLYGPVVQGADGLLYGPTTGGGSGGGGVIFKLSTVGHLTLLHQYDINVLTDGSNPRAGMVAATDGNFYGATSAGASYGSAPEGTLFRIDGSGNYSIRHVFDNTHGSLAEAALMQHTNGKIYGMTQRGGPTNVGIVYSLDEGLAPFVHVATAFGSSGQTVSIIGTGLHGTTGVTIGGVPASFTVVSNTYVTATVPPDAASGVIAVTTPSGTLSGDHQFAVVPVVSGFTPTSGPVGTQVTITGTGFLGATQVTFNGTKAASITVNGATSITATVPTGATSGRLTVKTPSGNANSVGSFTVTP